MKRKYSKIIALLAAAVVLGATVLAALRLTGRIEQQGQQMDTLNQENELLREQVQKLEEKLLHFMTVASLNSWELTAEPWEDGSGADVTFTAAPVEYMPGMSATLVVMLDGKLTERVECSWDGTVFSGTASLAAEDGYSYFCLLKSSGGEQELSLMGPESENSGIPVYLRSSMLAYCNLVIHDWNLQNENMQVLTSAYAQVQVPQIQAEQLSIATQELVMRHNGQVIARVATNLTPSEVLGSYEMLINDLRLPMPKLEREDVLELYLEVSLSDGRQLQTLGISWHVENGELAASVG